MPEFKTLKTGFAQVALAVLVTGGVLLFGGLAANASNGRAGQSQIPCGSIIPGLQRSAGFVPQPCPTITLDTTTTSTTVVTTTEPETTTTGVEPTTTVAPTTTTAPPAVSPRVLARTGSNTVPMVGLAFGLLAAGGIVLTASRKRAQV